jgi:hypothetical protein
VGIKVAGVVDDGALPAMLLEEHWAEGEELVLERAAMHLILPFVRAAQDRLSITAAAAADGVRQAGLVDHTIQTISVVQAAQAAKPSTLLVKQYLAVWPINGDRWVKLCLSMQYLINSSADGIV